MAEPAIPGPQIETAPTLLADASASPSASRSRAGSSASDEPTEPALSSDGARRELEPRPVPREGARLGRYLVLGELGRGGMGTVLEAFDRTLDRRVALKVLHPELGRQHTERLMREARALAKLSHPHVVQVYEVGEADGQAFIAMELVQGRSLHAWASGTSRRSWRELVQAYVQAGEGLAAAHARGLVHRDFKPGNAVIDDEGRVRVLDFGLARRADDAPEPATDASTGDASRPDAPASEATLTRTGAVVGTPAYMAPEQLRGAEADARSDQFSFCVSLHEALYGARPFEGTSIVALAVAMSTGEIRSAPRGSDVPSAVRAAVVRGLAIDPTARWPSMAELLAALRRTVAPRRRGWLALGIGGGLAALGLGLGRYAAVGLRCGGAADQLAGVWDEARRQEVAAAILGTGLSYAADTWERVEPRLDAYASAWTDAYTEACEATSVRQEQSAEVMDLRMACLQEREVALREAVDVLADADAARVEHAVTLVTNLPGVPRCADVEALRAELPPPEDPAAAEQVEALRGRLAQARALHDAGEYVEGLAVAEPAVLAADALAHPPLVAEALLVRSVAYDSLGRFAEAEADAERSYLLAAELGHARVAAAAVRRLAFVVGHRQARHDAGLQWGKTALALARGRLLEPMEEVVALQAVGEVLVDRGQPVDARAHFERALAMAEREQGLDSLAVAALLGSLGRVLWILGDLEPALLDNQRALAIREQGLGPRHPSVASSLGHISAVLGRMGRYEEALAAARRAVEVGEAALGPDHPDLADWLDNVATSSMELGDVASALPVLERAKALRERALGPRHPDVAHSHAVLGHALLQQGRLAEARAHAQHALEIHEATLGPRHPELVGSLLALVQIERAAHDDPAARRHAERAVAILEESDVASGLLSEARFELARATWSDPAQRVRARALVERARDACADPGEPCGDTIPELEAWLAAHPDP